MQQGGWGTSQRTSLFVYTVTVVWLEAKRGIITQPVIYPTISSIASSRSIQSMLTIDLGSLAPGQDKERSRDRERREGRYFYLPVQWLSLGKGRQLVKLRS